MTTPTHDAGAPHGAFGRVIGAVFMLVFIAAAVGMATMAGRSGAPWVFTLVPWGMALIGVLLLIRLLTVRTPAAAASPQAPLADPVRERVCEYCGRRTTGVETVCTGCGGRVD